MGVVMTVRLVCVSVSVFVAVAGRMCARHAFRVEGVHRGDRRWTGDLRLATALALADVNIFA